MEILDEAKNGNKFDTVPFAINLLKWAIFASIVGILSGSASALFLWLLDWATETRTSHPWLLFLLPICGVAIGAIYTLFGKSVAAGNNLLLEEIHNPKGPIPFRLAPMVLIGTVATHLFGGSAGREGTAVQMGGALADFAVRILRVTGDDRKTMIMVGIAAGFGSIFGTPVAGAIFGIEVLAIGGFRTGAMAPCLIGSVVGDLVCRQYGIRHHVYAPVAPLNFTPALLGTVVVASVAFAAAAIIFVELTHRISKIGGDLPGVSFWKPVVGGFVVVALTLAVGNQDFNGLGIPLIDRSFSNEQIPFYWFAIKILFTAVTLGTGFKGGEVTPLFCIGATLGSSFARFAHVDPALFAALGFVGVFAGAANTPLACIVMGIELFGGHLAAPLAVVCTIAYLATGNRGIYSSQRLTVSKATFADVEASHPLATYMERSL